MRVSGFIAEVSSELVVFKEHCGVQEVYRLQQLLIGEFDVGVAAVQVVEEVNTSINFLFPKPNITKK